MPRAPAIAVAQATLWLAAMSPLMAQSYERAPILYSTAELDDPIARLQKRIDAGEVELEFEEGRGYLSSVLRALEVPVSSQVLVFSKTSFQARLISPRSPRALYFGDDIYVGWVRGGDVVEVSSVDPKQGAIFYTLPQRASPRPRFQRRVEECLQCHDSSLTGHVPGLLVRSVVPDPEGHPILSAGTFSTDQTSPLARRWGGWYVTGKHGEQSHMGNVFAPSRDDPQLPRKEGQNLTDLGGKIDVRPYLSPHSDIVALMVLEHQTRMHNRITQAGFQTRIALHQNAEINRMLEKPEDELSPSTKRRIAAAGDEVLEHMLFRGEAKLTAPVRGTSRFAEEFAARGPRDSRGRSLRDLDLEQRLFRHPCSFLVYSEAFDALPAPVLEHIYRRLWKVLTGADSSERFSHLSTGTRRAILEILLETKRGLPAYWKRKSAPDAEPEKPPPAPRAVRL